MFNVNHCTIYFTPLDFCSGTSFFVRWKLYFPTMFFVNIWFDKNCLRIQYFNFNNFTVFFYEIVCIPYYCLLRFNRSTDYCAIACRVFLAMKTKRKAWENNRIRARPFGQNAMSGKVYWTLY